MKTAHARPFPRPTVRHPRPGLPSTRGVEMALRVALAVVLFGTMVWYLLWLAARNDAGFPAVSPAEPEAGLELLLSGAVTSNLSLGAADIETVRRTVQCDASGFRVASPSGTAFPLELTFSGIPADASSSLYALGSRGDVTLRVNGAPYTLLSGTLTTTPGGHTFHASFVDAQSQPLQLSGRLVCP